MGWVLGNLTALYTLPSTQIEEAITKLDEALKAAPQKQYIKARSRELRKKNFSVRVIIINLLNLFVLTLLPLSILIGPPRLLGWLIPEAFAWTLSVPDKWIFGFIFIIQLLIFIEKGAGPWGKGCKTLWKARKWRKEHP